MSGNLTDKEIKVDLDATSAYRTIRDIVLSVRKLEVAGHSKIYIDISEGNLYVKARSAGN